MSDHHRTSGLKDKERGGHYQTSFYEHNGIAKRHKLNGTAITQPPAQGPYSLSSVVRRSTKSTYISFLGGYLDSL
jgi:hypothetical protein